MKSIKKQWYSIAIFTMILLAYILSKLHLPLPSGVANFVKFTFIILIFLISGLTIRSRQLIASVKHWKLHLWVQVISFTLFPIVVILVGTTVFSQTTDSLVYLGFLVLACIPTTITSCVVFTRNAGGNEEGALFNATLGNILGIFLTPFLIYLIIGQSIDLDPTEAIKKLFSLVILPFLAGQILRNYFLLKINEPKAKLASSWMVLGIMLIVFIAAFNQSINLNLTDFIIIVVLCFILKITFTAFTWYSSKLIKSSFTLADRKCLTITATQKTLALGLPIITILFANNPNLAILSLPILAYHTIQLFIDGILVGIMANKVEEF